MSGGFPCGSIPTQHLLHQGRRGKGRTGITKTNGWRWLLAPQISHTDMEPLDTLPSSGFPEHLLQCPEQQQLSGSRNSARLLAQTPPWTCPQPHPPSLSTPRAWGFIKVMSPCPCDRPTWCFPRQGGAGGFLVFKSMLLKKKTNRKTNQKKKKR